MKRSREKNKFMHLLGVIQRPLVFAIIFAGLTSLLLYKPSTHAASARAKTATGVIFGGGLGTGIAAAAGGAKWIPLGLGIGGLAGGLLARYIRKKNEKYRLQKAQQQPHSNQQAKHYQENIVKDENVFKYKSRNSMRRPKYVSYQ